MSDSSKNSDSDDSIRKKKLSKKRPKSGSSSDSDSTNDSDSDTGRTKKKRKKIRTGSDSSSSSSSSSSSDAEKENAPVPEKSNSSDVDMPADIVPNTTAQDEDDPFAGGERKLITAGVQENDNRSDFDRLMAKKKAKNRGIRSRGDSTFISDADDIINELMRKMAEASGQDKQDAQSGKPAIAKLKLLKEVQRYFTIKDYQEAFIENGVMTAIADWLSPLPNGALPNLIVRTFLLKTLKEFPPCSTETLKASGVGKAVNRLSLHPKELKDNKKLCKQLIRTYSKQIFGISDLAIGSSKEERQERDLDRLRRFGPSKKSAYQEKQEILRKAAANLRPNDKGFVSRARVPVPDNRDYLIRPKSIIDRDEIGDIRKSVKKAKTGNQLKLLETQKKLERMKPQKVKRAESINISGSKML